MYHSCALRQFLCILCAVACIGLKCNSRTIRAAVANIVLSSTVFNNPLLVVQAREVASIPTSGFVFKDYLKVTAFEDPKVPGVALYIADVDRSLADKINSDFFNDPSSSSIACTKTGQIKTPLKVSTSVEGEEIFEEARNLFFKTIRVRRIYDKGKKTLIYVSYNTRLDKNADQNKSRFKTSMCVVPIDSGQ